MTSNLHNQQINKPPPYDEKKAISVSINVSENELYKNVKQTSQQQPDRKKNEKEKADDKSTGFLSQFDPDASISIRSLLSNIIIIIILVLLISLIFVKYGRIKTKGIIILGIAQIIMLKWTTQSISKSENTVKTDT